MSKKVSKDEPTRSPNQYIIELIEEKRAVPIKEDDRRVRALSAHIKKWAGGDLTRIFVSGSSRKRTSLKGSSDLDLFISLSSSMSASLEEKFFSLAEYLKSKKIDIRIQNVSIRAMYYSLQIDLVPGKKMPRQPHKHFLHTNRREDQYRIQTNVNKHVNFVINSRRINEIIALKIWRETNNLKFPSMYLEMYAIKALSGKWSAKHFLARNILFVLEDIAKYFHSTAVYDPSNTSNTISDSLFKYEKNEIQKAAQRAIKKEYISEILY